MHKHLQPLLRRSLVAVVAVTILGGCHLNADGQLVGEPAQDDVVGVIANEFPSNADSAVRVADCESSLDPSAVSRGGGNWGLFQINTVHRQAFQDVTGVPFDQGVLDPYLNTKFARWLYDASGGWGPWSCSWAA